MPAPRDLVPVDRLEDLLSEKDLTQRDLAKRAGMVQSTISHAKRTGTIRVGNARKMARALGVGVEELARQGRERTDDGEVKDYERENLRRESENRFSEHPPSPTATRRSTVVIELGPETRDVLLRLADSIEAIVWKAKNS